VPNLTVADVGEHALIERIRARLTSPRWLVVGPGDDAAIIEPERGALEVITTDAQVEDIHFDRRYVPAGAIGHRALAVNLSDLAAMGARPRAALLSLMAPGDLALDAFDGILDGLLALATEHRVALIGGNITRSPGPLVVDVTALGSVRRRRMLTRDGARPGDGVYVTGWLGDAAVGMRRLRGSPAGQLPPIGDPARRSRPEDRFLHPEPRVRAGLLLGRTRAASSCMDLSDGLADGVRQVAAASNVGMIIDAEALPISAAVRQFHLDHGSGSALDTALVGGDDYELLFTVRPSRRGRLRGVRQQVGDLPITRIGVVTKERSLVVKSAGGTHAVPEGFEHFR
jgi:thiamine-monophosphate kinase